MGLHRDRMGKRHRSKRPAQREAKRAMKKARFGSKPKGAAAADDGMNAGDAEETREAMTKGMKLFEEYYAKQEVLAEEDLAEMVRGDEEAAACGFSGVLASVEEGGGGRRDARG